MRRSARTPRKPPAFVAGASTGDFHDGIPPGLLTNPEASSSPPRALAIKRVSSLQQLSSPPISPLVPASSPTTTSPAAARMNKITTVCAVLVACEFVWVFRILASRGWVEVVSVAGFALALLLSMVATKAAVGELLAPVDATVTLSGSESESESGSGAVSGSLSVKGEKIRNQAWHLVMHSAFAAAEACVLFRPGWEGAEGGWVRDTTTLWSPSLDQQGMSREVRLLYQMQLAAWLTTAVNQFFKPPDKDQIAMLTHHIATVFLVAASYQINAHRIGLLILFVHDFSDIPCDALKLANNLGLSGARHCFLVEGLFASVMGTWAAMRLYVFPRYLVYSALVEARFALDGGAGNRGSKQDDPESWSWLASIVRQPVHVGKGGVACPYWLHTAFCLVILMVLHFYWFFLFCRIAKRLLGGENARSVSANEYTSVADTRAIPPTSPPRRYIVPCRKKKRRSSTSTTDTDTTIDTDTDTDTTSATTASGTLLVPTQWAKRALRGVRLSLTAAVAVLLLVVAGLAVGLVVTPEVLRAQDALYGEEADALAMAAATRGLVGLEDGAARGGKAPYVIPDPSTTVFKLGATATAEQRAFLRYHGFLIFKGALAREEVTDMEVERSRIEADLIARNVSSIFGVPLFRGACPDGRPMACIHRIPFVSLQSARIKALIHDKRWVPMKELFTDDFFSSSTTIDASAPGAPGAPDNGNGNNNGVRTVRTVRVGDEEKDGLVMNSYVKLAPANGSGSGGGSTFSKKWSRNQVRLSVVSTQLSLFDSTSHHLRSLFFTLCLYSRCESMRTFYSNLPEPCV